MGQYYHPINVDKKETVYSHDFGNGLKLMEHSYVENDFMQAVEVLLAPFGPWHKCKLVWAGDYADPEEGSEQTLYSIVSDEGETIAPYEVDKLKADNKFDTKEYRYIVNHDAKVYVDKYEMVKQPPDEDGEEQFEWRVHPLSLLTAEGNGRGGGDYHDKYPEFDNVGAWARASISVEKEIPEGYTKEFYDFREWEAPETD